MKIEQRSCPDRLGYAAVQINRVGWGAAFLQEHKIELDKKYEKFFWHSCKYPWLIFVV